MASEDWIPEDSERKWLPAVDVRQVVGSLPPGLVNVDDPAWDDVLPDGTPPREIRVAVRGLGDADVAVVEKSLTDLWTLACGYGNTTVAGVLVVPSLIRAPVHVGPRLRAEMLQLAGHMARVDSMRLEVRPGLLRTMQPIPVYDPWGYLENWSVEAVRAMLGRDGDLLTALMRDDSSQVRGRAAYVLAAAEPVGFDLVDVMRARLAVESDPAVQMILVLCIAQIEKDRDRTAEALPWARGLWSDPAASLGVRLGGVIAWLGLAPADPSPPALQALLATMPTPAVGELLRELPWIWSVTNREDHLAHWWQNLQIPCPSDADL